MKKILVTGATGFVGYHVARKLVERNWGEVVCLARPRSERKFLRELGVRIAEGDLMDPPSLERAAQGCEMLFHVAADYRLWSRDKSELITHNVRGTENILNAARAAGMSRIVYTSSVSAVGRPEPDLPKSPEKLASLSRDQWERRWNGDESMDPSEHQQIGPYKKSKFQAELVARRFAREGLPLVIVNPSTPVGSHDIRPTPTGKMIVDFLNRKMPAYLDTGLNLVDAEDVADGHLLAAEKGRAGERYILGSKNLMLKEILQSLASISGLPAPAMKIPYWIAYASGWCSTMLAEITGRPPGIPLDGVKMASELMFYDCSKAERELGLKPRPVDAALEKAVRFFRDNGYC